MPVSFSMSSVCPTFPFSCFLLFFFIGLGMNDEDKLAACDVEIRIFANVN